MSNEWHSSHVLRHHLIIYNLLITSFPASVNCQLSLLVIVQMGLTMRSDLLFA